MILLLIYAVASIFFSFMCSIWEAVLLSITPAYTNTKVQEGSSMGKSLKEFKEDIDKPLSAILTLNTIAHTVGAIMVGTQAAKLYGTSEPLLEPFGFAITWEFIIAVIMTLLILVLSEIIPKTIGASNWKNLAPFTVKSINLLLILLMPLIWFSSLITRRFKGGGGHGSSVLSRADFLAMTNVGTADGTIAENESKIIKNLLTLEKLKVEDIMTPRIVMNLANEDMTLEEYYNANKPFRFSRIPLYNGDTANTITGVVLKDEILSEMLEGRGDKKLQSIRRPAHMINENSLLTELFNSDTGVGTHMHVVVDQYGSITGLVTMEDVLETILGMEIVDETDKVVDLREYARSKWKERSKKMGIEIPE